MRNYHIYILLVSLLCITSCEKVDNLSDEASVLSFKITHVSDGIEIDNNNITITQDSKGNTISIPLLFGRKNFPLKLTADIQFSSTTDDIISVDENALNLKEFTFEDVYTSYSFYMISESGKPHLATVQLIDNPNAEILSFTPDLPKDSYSVTTRDNNILITLKQSLSWPIVITPVISKTATARYIDYNEGDSFTFQSPADNEKQITLLADNEDTKTWNIKIVPPIENCDFERWIKEGTKNVNIDPTPGKGLGWATANNQFVAGTTPVEHNGGKAAQMTTGIQELSGIGIGDLITAGTIFTGYFQMNLSALNDPAKMTYFGIPFIMRPVSISVEAKYTPGSKFQQSVKGGDGKYKLTDISGIDEGRIWVKLLYWGGKGDLEYHDKPVDGLIELGAGELIFTGDASFRNWSNHIIPIEYNSTYKFLEPTHISIVMTSSRQGDYFIGAKGSTLTVDNVTINY